jgi:5'-methylthioadenosine phosphorylase
MSELEPGKSREKTIGVIGGSGLYEIEGLTDVEEVAVDTPFGEPSDRFVTGRLGEVKLVFLPRHGRGHKILPSDINYRANVFAMKKLGVEWLISISAVGSMREDIEPGHMVIIDQFFDRTSKRASSFFGDGIVGHVEFAEPICSELADVLYDAAVAAGATVHKGGTYICIEGPQFSTKAESNIYRKWGVDVIGMTNIPEAKLAREAELCYATVALSTDYDCWREGAESVTVDMILSTIAKNVSTAKDIIGRAAPLIKNERVCGCASAMRFATVTSTAAIKDKKKQDMELLLGKYIK